MTNRSLIASIAANTRWANETNRTAATAKARATRWQNYLDAHDGDPVRARNAYRADMQRAALKASKVRAAKSTKRSAIKKAQGLGDG